MSKHTFEYSVLPGLKGTVPSPIIPLTLKYKKEYFPTFALVDSGAMTGCISTVIAEELGIDWNAIPVEIGIGVGSNFRYHPHTIDFIIDEIPYSAKINIIEGIAAYKCILGQSDFFQRAKVTFERYNKKFYVEFRDYN